MQSWWQQHEAVLTSGLFGTSAPWLSDALSFTSAPNGSLKPSSFPYHFITYLWVHWVAVWGIPKAPSVPGNRSHGETLSSADSELHGLGLPAPQNLLHSSVGYTWLAQPSAVFNRRHFPHRLKKITLFCSLWFKNLVSNNFFSPQHSPVC